MHRTQAGVAFLDDARKRRKRSQVASPGPPPSATLLEQQDPGLGAEDSSGYAVDLAAELLDPQPEAPGGGADAILAQHEAAAETRTSPRVADERLDDAPADEILLALEAHHRRAEPHQHHLAPRGSADLDAQQAQRPLAKPATARPKFKRPRPSRPLLASGALAAALVAITIGGTSPSASRTADHLAPSTPSTAAAPLAAANFPVHRLLAATHRQAASDAHANKGAQRRTRRSNALAPRHSHTGGAASSSGTPALTASSAAVNNTPTSAPSYTATPAASNSQPTSGSSPQPAGPAGAGTAGGNCNPKCS
jgi:hypothetical protein